MSKPTYEELKKRIKELQRAEVERKKANDALKESEETLKKVHAVANIVSWKWDFESNKVTWSDEMCKTFGIDPAEFDGNIETAICKAIHPNDREKVRKANEYMLSQHKSYPLEYRIVQPDGEECVVWSDGDVIFDANGKATGILGYVQDITERKKAKEALRKSEEFFFSLLSNSPNPMVVINPDTSIRYLNSAMENLTGFSSEELIGRKAPHPWWIKETMQKTSEELEKAMDEGAQRVEKLFQKKNGEQFWAEITSSPIKNNEKLQYLLANFVDITERKNAEETLRESEERYKGLSEAALEGIVIHDKGILIDANSRFTKMFGYELEGLIGKNLIELLAQPDYKDLFREKIAGGNTKPDEIMTHRKDGTVFPVELEVREANYKGKILKVVAVRDITERKQLKEQLQIRQNMDSLGTLAGGISHDFNNILAGIMGYINMLNLESDGLTDIQKEYIENAEKGCDRAAELIAQFQTFTKGTVSEKTSVDIYVAANEVFNILKETTDRLIEKKISLKPGEFYVKANPSDFNQVLLNLGTNAVQAIEERGVKKGDYIKISAKEYRSKGRDRIGLPEGEYVRILFVDNGKGMTDEVRRRAFDLLFTTREKSGKRGRGLGLAMVYNIVTRTHNGYIDLESKEGKGTKIHIYLPKSQPKKEIEEKELIGTIGGGNETILVVDDEEMILRLVETILKKYGYNVKTAIDGEQALKIYKKHKNSIDTIILDLIMPRMSGKMVFEKMLEINPDVKVIISSGHSDEYAREGILSQAKGYVKKPYKLDDLAQTVRTVLDL